LKKNTASVAALITGSAVLGAFAAVGALLASCTPNRATTSTTTIAQQAVPTANPPTESILPPPSPEASPATVGASPSIWIYVVVRNSEGVAQLKREAISLKPGETPALAGLNHMAEMQDSPLPKGTRAVSVKFGEDGTATVDFNEALKEGFESDGGDEKEALVLNAILATVGQFPNVKQVQILVNSEKVSLGGMQDTTQPMPVPPNVGTQVSQKTATEGGGAR
jgi:hypothetical protein